MLASSTQEDGLALIYIDRYVDCDSSSCGSKADPAPLRSHLVHEVTSPQAFEGLYVPHTRILATI